MKTEPTYPILVSAARLLEEYGWTQGALSEGVKHCLTGAIYRVSLPIPIEQGMEGEALFKLSDETKDAVRALARAIGDAYAPDQAMLNIVRDSWAAGNITDDEFDLYADSTKVIVWNDQSERTIDQVIELLERVAYGLDGREHVRENLGIAVRT